MTRPNGPFEKVVHEADLCVVGGGMAGLCAALAAARHGAKVVLMQDRPVLGGNASSETRVHICGADRHNHRKNMRETGILEELRLTNLHRNRQRSFGVWDTVCYEAARYQQGLDLLLNCSCLHADMDGPRIASVTGWQLTTYRYHTVRAKVFADCSGDGVLAPLTGADCRMGREGREEYGEPIAPPQPDDRTMGMSILFQTRRHDRPQPFDPPAWACRFDRCDDLPGGSRAHRWWEMGYWWVELGGEHHSIADTEKLRDELLRIAYGVWDHVKNRCCWSDQAANWAIDWVQFLPAKRESVRYVGDHVLTQLDLEAEGRFDDLVAYGGWTMDDHDPAGFWAVKDGRPPTTHHPTPVPYGIPYRSLYSRNVPNLMFAGRCHSATHAAMSSTRVMGTGCSMGQAAGTAAAMAAGLGVDPRAIGGRIGELQQALLRDDAYLPWVAQRFGPLTASAALAASRGDPQPLGDGTNRPVGDDPHAWVHSPGDWVEMRFPSRRRVEQVTLLLDSALEMNIQLSYHQPDDQLNAPPPPLQRVFTVEALADGRWSPVAKVDNNCRRLVRLAVARDIEALRYILHETWAPAESSKLFAFYVD